MSSVTQLWNRLEDHLRAHAPDALRSLNPPAALAELQSTMRKLGTDLPADIIESLLVHDGQRVVDPVPLVPNEYDPETREYLATWGDLSSARKMVATTQLRGRAMSDYWKLDPKDVRGPVRHDGNWTFVLFVDSGSGDALAIDMNPPREGEVGHIVAINHDSSVALRVLAPSFTEWFERLVARYQSGRYSINQSRAVDRFDPDVEVVS